ncbi:MAG TPA: hypothetical protein VE029_05065 [Rhizobacter sp.]|nr:hypothetical protein [Rhizobacter sp.]
MIVRIEIEPVEASEFAYRVTYEAEALYADQGLASVEEALVAAVEGLSPDVVGVEVAYGGVISGTYPLDVVALNLAQIVAHALNTAAAIQQARSRG